MNNHLLLTLAVSVIPILAIAFVALLLLLKLYVKIRSKFNVTVNCWFCNENTRVPYNESNSWTCPKCEQYNGFTRDGDYNRILPQQLDCSTVSRSSGQKNGSSVFDTSDLFSSMPPQNGFCNGCNEAQRLKVEKLSQFEPKRESRFDEELKAYKAQLEEQYRLCATCERHLKKVLREKKKMVLGSKFLDFIIKGAETLQQPHFDKHRHAKQQLWKKRISLNITLLTLINLGCLLTILPAVSREHLIRLLGEKVGQYAFIVFSHFVTLGRLFTTYVNGIGEHPTLAKISLFVRTLFMMLLYTLGLKIPQIARFNFTNLYVLSCPFAILGLAFGYNIVDGFKLTRFTFLLALWSAFAGSLVEEHFFFSQNMMMLLASVLTFILSLTSKEDNSAQIHDNTASSFHRIYSEDYLSDEDTISLLSQQLNCSTSSNMDRSFSPPLKENHHALLSPRFTRSPLTSSMFSLNHPTSRPQLSPASSYKSCWYNGNQSMGFEYPNPFNDCAKSVRSGVLEKSKSNHFNSNLDLGFREISQPPIFSRSSGNNLANTSLTNTPSFKSPFNYSHEPSAAFQQRNDHCYMFSTDMGKQFNSLTSNNTSLHSPFSVSSNSVYQKPRAPPDERATNLLTPSRFSTSCLAGSNASTTSWLSGGYFNQQRMGMGHSLSHSNVFAPQEHRQGMSAIDENISRASSQSSGFESQNDRLNVSRENSFGLEASDLLKRTTSLEAAKAFKPIETNGGRTITPRPSLLSNYSLPLTQPLSVNCALNSSQSELWRAPSMRRTLNGVRDSFNLHKINEDLPTINRGDLLKKWKETQTVS